MSSVPWISELTSDYWWDQRLAAAQDGQGRDDYKAGLAPRSADENYLMGYNDEKRNGAGKIQTQ